MILFDITIDEVTLSTGKPDGHSATRADFSGLLFEVSFCPAALDASNKWLVAKTILKSACDIFIPKSNIFSAQSPKWFCPEIRQFANHTHTL